MDVVIFSCSHALILLAPSNYTSGFSNEISFVFEFQADLGIYKNKLKVEGPDPYVKFTLARFSPDYAVTDRETDLTVRIVI